MTQAATLAQLASSGALSADTSGNVGIGTTSPRLVAGYTTVGINNTTGGFTDIFAANTRVSSFGGDASSTYVSAVASAPLLFATGNTERARIDTSGNLLVNTTSPNPGGASVSGKQAIVFNPSTHGGLVIASNSGAGTLQQFTSTAFGVVGSITTSGTATAYNTSSDYRLKENIAPMVGALATVAQLKPVTYNWKIDGSAGQGFIAHELAEVVPDCVTGEKDAVNEDGSIKTQGIDTSFLVATLTAAIQELKAELDVCKAEIAALKGV
jgi:hypothetical protein